jgi:hypothetical protein
MINVCYGKTGMKLRSETIISAYYTLKPSERVMVLVRNMYGEPGDRDIRKVIGTPGYDTYDIHLLVLILLTALTMVKNWLESARNSGKWRKEILLSGS